MGTKDKCSCETFSVVERLELCELECSYVLDLLDEIDVPIEVFDCRNSLNSFDNPFDSIICLLGSIHSDFTRGLGGSVLNGPEKSHVDYTNKTIDSPKIIQKTCSTKQDDWSQDQGNQEVNFFKVVEICSVEIHNFAKTHEM
jgi:hypothetical protein